MYTHRAVTTTDFEIIASFPQDTVELFHMFPNASYPLTSAQLEEAAGIRFKPTVILHLNEIVAYAIFYRQDNDYWLGNVIVSPSFRGQGAAQYLIHTMEMIAKEDLNSTRLKVACHSSNARGLFFYTK